ncbi:MAG: hypothetical protein AVDCRST_MAG33-2613 [uncultured Thermomicrobiales bacterium]|uniref:Cell envelope-related transcriptional attenuator domain-containing protein n=1 Tax=uncultured Thermomicrobiales bacterium TaxID=1645740 RepID=A0A6J4V9A1_9BACT|nr:MAG: hypothetical protein AVDCRST_MAG33-2613 [uncultured Thermomicrobiales bacterium]
MDTRIGKGAGSDPVHSGQRLRDLVVVRSGQTTDAPSRRLGGATWVRTATLPNGQIDSEALQTQPASRPRPVRRKRHWYARPVPIVLLALLLVAGSLMGYVLNRVTDAMGEVQRVSTPPPAVVTTDEEIGPAEFTIDTQPAILALEDSGIVPESDPGLLGDFQNGATNLNDLAGGAAAAAGVADGNQSARTIMLLGVDARPGAAIDVGVRADTIMVVRLDPTAGTCRILSVPRDTQVQLPGYGQSKINHALLVGGIPYQELVVEQTLGIPIDHYALIDFNAFEGLVDEVGGIVVDVPSDLVGTDGQVAFAAGPQSMDGETALRYARFRTVSDGGDQARVERQWGVLRALGQQADRNDLVQELNTLLPAMSEHVRTDLTVTELTGIAQSLDGRCTSESAETRQLDGSRLRQQDAILQQSVYVNVVSEAVLRERVQWLLS